MFAPLALWVACIPQPPSSASYDPPETPPRDGPVLATGSSTVAVSADHRYVYAVNVDEGTLSRTDGDVVDELDVGTEPTRVTVANGRVFVSLRGERGLAVVDEASFTVEAVLDTGTEPVGVLAAPDGSRVYVACSTSRRVEEWDAATLTRTRAFDIPAEPRWLAITPDGATLFVVSPYGRQFDRIDLATGEAREMRLPSMAVSALDGFNARATGDPAVSTDGTTLAIPVTYTDNTTREDEDPAESEGFYGSQGPQRFFSTLDTFYIPSGDPNGEIVVVSDTLFGEASTYRSYLSSVTAAPDGWAWVATMEGSGAVLWIASHVLAEPSLEGNIDRAHASVVAEAPAGPRGVAFLSEDEAVSHQFIDRSLAWIDAKTLSAMLGDEQNGVSLYPDMGTPRGRSTTIAVSALPADVEEGRALFYTAGDGFMGALGSGVACATCHFDGRNDGLTWPLFAGDRNTPSLAGGVADTAPVTWTGEVANAAEEARLTNGTRMGGADLDDATAAAIGAFVDQIRLPDLPDPTDPDAVARGEAVFAEVGCASCHAGEAYTDNATHTVRGVDGINTPTLRGIALTAPYFHDGSASTLAEVIEAASLGEMGSPFEITPAAAADLEAWLRTR